MREDVDRALLNRFVQGDQDAFEWLFRYFEADAYRWILRIVRDTSAADDVLVETFWRAYRGRARYDASRAFGAWVRGIATNAALDHLRTLRRHPASQAPVDAVAAPERPDAEVKGLVARAFRALPPALQVVAVLALIEERPYTDRRRAHPSRRHRQVAGLSRDARPEKRTGAAGNHAMNDDERLQQLLRSALAASEDRRGATDLWSSVVDRMQQRPGWTWIDMAVAAVVATAILLFPECVFVLSYHL